MTLTIVTSNPGSGGAVFATDANASSNNYPIGKLAWGSVGVFNLVDTSAGQAWPVQPGNSTVWTVSATNNAVSITNTLTLSGSVSVVNSTASNLKIDLSGTGANATAINVSVTGPVSLASGSTVVANAGTGTFQTSIVGGVSVLNGSITVTQATATNLKVDLSGTAANATPINVSVAAGVSVLGFVSVNLGQVGGSNISIGQATMGQSLPVVIASNQSDVGVNIDKVGGSTVTLGQAAMSSSFPVVLATNQTNVPVSVIGNVSVHQTANARGGYTAFVCVACSGAIGTVKNSPAKLVGWYIYNTHTAPVYLNVYNTSSGAALATGAALSFGIPTSAGANMMDAAGIDFTNGIQISATVTANGTVSASNPLVVNLFYK